MADIRRTRYYAVAEGVEVVDGEFKKVSYMVNGRFKDWTAANFAIRRIHPDFLAKDIKVYKQQGIMSEEGFFQQAQVSDPVLLETSSGETGDKK